MKKKLFISTLLLTAIFMAGCGSKQESQTEKEVYDERNFFELKADDIVMIRKYTMLCSADSETINEIFDEKTTKMYADYIETINAGDEMEKVLYYGTSSNHYIIDKKGNEYEVDFYEEQFCVNDKTYENLDGKRFPDQFIYDEEGTDVKYVTDLIKDYKLIESVEFCKFGDEFEDYSSRALDENELKELGDILADAGEYLVEIEWSEDVRQVLNENKYMFVFKMSDGTMSTLKIQEDDMLDLWQFEKEGFERFSSEMYEFSQGLKD